jgi:hypothetical protein
MSLCAVSSQESAKQTSKIKVGNSKIKVGNLRAKN